MSFEILRNILLGNIKQDIINNVMKNWSSFIKERFLRKRAASGINKVRGPKKGIDF